MKNPSVFISEAQIHKRVVELGQSITKDFRRKRKQPLLCISVLKGSVLFFSDLIRKIDVPLAIDFLQVSSYGQKTVSSGVVKIGLDLSVPLEGRDVLVVEDIVDTGLTLDYLLKNLRLRKPASLRVCSLLLKPANLQRQIPIDYLGFTVGNRFFVGYGLDAAERYRNLPYLAVLSENENEERNTT